MRYHHNLQVNDTVTMLNGDTMRVTRIVWNCVFGLRQREDGSWHTREETIHAWAIQH